MTRRAPLPPDDAVAHQPLCRFESSSRTAHRTGLIHEAASTNRNLYRLMIRARFGRLPLSYGRREWAEAIGLASVDDEVCRDELQTVPISLRLAFHLSCPLSSSQDIGPSTEFPSLQHCLVSAASGSIPPRAGPLRL
ncbi:hypothetical protein CSUB01_11072 [Colletotrichum sublineola]|uniref:Uncharacterized protein n=1 Tax=Colletotrichum sublineola TaxID=1173701 RepID=A0A066Y115_COLSU|nr:hypothetical protein CSUB01_11072 [Colletotrichum sublineola]